MELRGTIYGNRLLALSTQNVTDQLKPTTRSPLRIKYAGKTHTSLSLSLSMNVLNDHAVRFAVVQTSVPQNEAELQLYRVMQRASLLGYYDTLLEMGKPAH